MKVFFRIFVRGFDFGSFLLMGGALVLVIGLGVAQLLWEHRQKKRRKQ